MTRLLTNSSADLFTTCQQRWHYEVGMGMKPRLTPKALSFGTLIHKAMEVYWGSVNGTASVDAVVAGCLFGVSDFSEKRLDEIKDMVSSSGGLYRVGMEEQLAKAIEETDGMVKLATGLVEMFVAKYLADDRKRWNVLAIEKRIERVLRTPTGARSPCMFAGILDLVLEDKTNGFLYVMDHKTTAESNPSALQREFPLRPQSKGYMWLASQEWPDKVVHGFVYNVLRKKLPADPYPFKDGKPKDGKRISTSQGIDTTTAKFLAAIDKHDPGNNDAYSDILDRIAFTEKRFLWRYEIGISDAEIREWELDRWRVSRAMGLACGSRSSGFVRNYAACFAIGRPCPFRDVCLSTASGAVDWSEFRKVDHGGSPELEEQDDDGEQAPF